MDILSGNQPSSSATSNRYSFSHQRRVSSGFSNTTTNDSSFTFFRSDNSGSDTASINTSHSNINPSPNPNQNNNSSSLVSDSHHQMFSVDPSVSASASANNSYSHHNDLLKSQNSRAMANEDLDINTVLSGLDLDYSSPRRLSSNNSNSSLLNTSATTATANPINDRVSISGNPLNNNNANNNNNINNINNNNNSNNNSSAAAAGMYQLNGINEIKPKHHQNRVSFSLLDFNNDANDMSVIGGTNGNANGAHTPNYHQHSWSVASFPSVANGNFGAQTQTVPTAAIAPVGASAAHSPLDYEPMGNGFNMGTYGNNGSSQELGLDPTAAAAQAAAQAAQANVAAQAAAAQAAAAAAANGGIDRNLHSPITAATPSAAYYDYPSSKSRFAHSASRSVSNPLFTNLENGNSRENLGSNRPTTASSNSSQYSNSGYPKVNNANVPTYFEENRGYPLNELNPNLLSNNPKSHVPSNNVISNNNNNNGTGNGNNGNSAAVPLWQKHLKNRLVDGNYGHRRSWSIASYSSVSNPPQQTNDPNGYIIASNNTNNNNNGSRENNNSSNDEFAAVNEMQNGSVIGIASPPVGGPPPVRTPQPSANYNQKSSRSGSNAAPINANYISSGSPMMFAQHQIHPHSHHPHPMNAYSHGVAAPPPPPHPYMNQYRSPVNHPAAVEQFRAASPNINGLPLNAYNGGQYGQNNGLAPLISASTGNGSPHPHHHGGNVAPGGPMSNLHVNNRRGFSGNFGNGNGNNSNNGNGNSNNGPQGGRRRGDDVSRFLNATIDDFKGQIYSLCKDQHGCRFLQRQLDIYDVQKNHKENVKLASDNSNGNGNGNNHKNKSENYAATLIFNEINNNIVELMTDQFGNYLIQKLLDQVTVKQRIQLIKNSCDHFIKISLDSHGTRALQKLIEVISTQEENLIIIRSFENDIVSLSRDLNGNHVVQKILTKFNYKSENIQFIFNAACKNCIKISTHRHGCCVLQRCLDYGSVDQCKQLSMVIAKNCLNLAVDPFGNYVVQYVLSKGEEESIKIIVDSILSKILFLSTHKFGSNVIEKILRINNLSHTVIDEILKNSSNNIIAGGANGANSTTVIGAPPPNVFLSKLLHDPYGNYVLQTVLDVAERPNQFNQLAELIKPILPSVRNTAHGRRIAAKVQAGQQLTSSAASVASQAQPQQMPLQDFVHQQQQQQQQQQIQMPLGQQQQQQQQQQQ